MNKIEKNDRWTIDELTSRSKDLFGDRSTDTPPFADLTIPADTTIEVSSQPRK